jgi:hypothetical protein
VKDHTISFTAEHLISDATAIPDLINVLNAKERAFVISGADVMGIVTRADLNKPLVRVFLFGLVSLLEMHMRFWIQKTYRNDSWRSLLSDGRREAASSLHERRRCQNEDISLLECLQFCDLGTLLSKSSDLKATLKLTSTRQTKELLQDAEELRNNLAHSQLDLVAGSTWPELTRVAAAIEDLINTSDRAVEKCANRSGTFDDRQ